MVDGLKVLSQGGKDQGNKPCCSWQSVFEQFSGYMHFTQGDAGQETKGQRPTVGERAQARRITRRASSVPELCSSSHEDRLEYLSRNTQLIHKA